MHVIRARPEFVVDPEHPGHWAEYGWDMYGLPGIKPMYWSEQVNIKGGGCIKLQYISEILEPPDWFIMLFMHKAMSIQVQCAT